MTWPLLPIAVLFIILGVGFFQDPEAFNKARSDVLGRRGNYHPEVIQFAAVILIVCGGGTLLFFLGSLIS